jgi:hypothetical protein
MPHILRKQSGSTLQRDVGEAPNGSACIPLLSQTPLGERLMRSMSRGRLLVLTVSALAVAGLVALVCIIQIYRTAQYPNGDGSGMQWIILTPVALLFFFIGVPALTTAMRGARALGRIEAAPESTTAGAEDPSRPPSPQILPGRGWAIALGLLVIYFLAPFIIGPLLGIFIGE